LFQAIDSEATNQPIVETPTQLLANQNEETFDTDETGAAAKYIAGEDTVLMMKMILPLCP
jgi:hypothetical protein